MATLRPQGRYTRVVNLEMLQSLGKSPSLFGLEMRLDPIPRLLLDLQSWLNSINLLFFCLVASYSRPIVLLTVEKDVLK